MDNRKNNRELLLVTGSKSTYRDLKKQLNQYFDHTIDIVPYMVDEQPTPLSKKYYAIFSSEEVYQDFLKLGNEKYIEEALISTRTLQIENIDKILLLPREEPILLVNDSAESAEECIALLQTLGFDYLHFIPYYAGCPTDITGISVAVTPGEVKKIPAGLSAVYDIGVRVFDVSTIIQILVHFGLLDEKIQSFSATYTQGIMNFANNLSDIANNLLKLQKTVKKELIGSGYYAKYHFDDIIGTSAPIERTKEIAMKIAKTDLSVLIEGENGTGKELFASAIHNASARASAPFVAINFSALPDNLIESELFGYEEGSFTGAKKGGKIGLFQQANGGTIFLDEIGDISPKMQAKLLRVIQEKEIMKVGGSSIIPVDVRIVAASNKNLKDMISNHTFRTDLFYRLREGYIHVPSLAQRKSDIPLLLDHWLKSTALSTKTVDDEVLQLLCKHNWPGNVRELLNLIKFATAVSEGEKITRSDLPYDSLQEFAKKSTPSHPIGLSSIDLSILEAVRSITAQHQIAGRNKIQLHLQEQGTQLSEYRIRKIIHRLLGLQLLSSQQGGYGLSLTPQGAEAVSS